MSNPLRLSRKRRSRLPRFLTLTVVPFALLLLWLFKNKPQPQKTAAVDVDIPLPPDNQPEAAQPVQAAPKGAAKSRPVKTAAPAAVEPGDDLTVIEGIGPKTASVLGVMGITRYQTLAAANPADIKLVLRSAGLNFGDPTTWPEQARLAAAGDWTALKALQDTLKGGRPPVA
ncbi:MAG TPA: hypothetical protein PKO03_04175 [Anaerolineaceae bacterium]|nr:hypothetical protein [Anaerolineaceae bacterium]HNS36696.1 hypothetical protein [Anaerolineaceae bacterium]